jgi:hypothetical protein
MERHVIVSIGSRWARTMRAPSCSVIVVAWELWASRSGWPGVLEATGDRGLDERFGRLDLTLPVHLPLHEAVAVGVAQRL